MKRLVIFLLCLALCFNVWSTFFQGNDCWSHGFSINHDDGKSFNAGLIETIKNHTVTLDIQGHTNREKETRYDQYSLLFSHPIEFYEVNLNVCVGAMYQGKGFLQNAQNLVHRIMKIHEVHFSYPEKAKIYPFLGFELDTDFAFSPYLIASYPWIVNGGIQYVCKNWRFRLGYNINSFKLSRIKDVYEENNGFIFEVKHNDVLVGYDYSCNLNNFIAYNTIYLNFLNIKKDRERSFIYTGYRFTDDGIYDTDSFEKGMFKLNLFSINGEYYKDGHKRRDFGSFTFGIHKEFVKGLDISATFGLSRKIFDLKIDENTVYSFATDFCLRYSFVFFKNIGFYAEAGLMYNGTQLPYYGIGLAF